MTFLFLLFLTVLYLALKIVVMVMFHPVIKAEHRSLSWMLLSTITLRRVQPAGRLGPILLRTGRLLVASIILYALLQWLNRSFIIPPPLLSYLAAPLLLTLMLLTSQIARVGLSWSGYLLPDLHNQPWKARGVADFWGRRWNLWMSDWFRQVLFTPMRRRPVLVMYMVFAFSGLIHEWVINVPLCMVTGRMLFGSMMLYFLLQGVGLHIERKWMTGNTVAQQLWVWIVVCLPLPLVVNEGMLRMLHLWPE